MSFLHNQCPKVTANVQARVVKLLMPSTAGARTKSKASLPSLSIPRPALRPGTRFFMSAGKHLRLISRCLTFTSLSPSWQMDSFAKVAIALGVVYVSYRCRFPFVSHGRNSQWASNYSSECLIQLIFFRAENILISPNYLNLHNYSSGKDSY